MVKIVPLILLFLVAWVHGAPDEMPVPAAPQGAGLVWAAIDPAAVKDGRVRPRMVQRMVDLLVMRVTGQPDVASAWRNLVKPGDRVGLKVSAAGAPVSSTRPAVIEAVALGLESAGVPADRIVIWDREWANMLQAGYSSLGRRYRVTSTDGTGGYDGKAIVTASVMGRLIYGDRDYDPKNPAEQVSSKSYLANVLSGGVDKVIHIPALSDHFASGLNGAISGMVLDNLDNWRRLARPPSYGDPYIAEAYSDSRIGGKVVLTILDALRPQYAGGPFPGAPYLVNHGAIFASRDPVALDVTGAALLDRFRADAGFPSLAKQTGWLQSAEVVGLGVASPEKIQVIPVTVSEEVPRP
ncbi:MAG: DUF362 domain-containing protein [Chthoniobacterales bacterium]